MAQGQTPVTPKDGLTTRQRRNRPLVVVHGGVGKGKSTAAFGLALRMLGYGRKVGVVRLPNAPEHAAGCAVPTGSWPGYAQAATDAEGNAVTVVPGRVVQRVRIPPRQVFELAKALTQQLEFWEQETGRRTGA